MGEQDFEPYPTSGADEMPKEPRVPIDEQAEAEDRQRYMTMVDTAATQARAAHHRSFASESIDSKKSRADSAMCLSFLALYVQLDG